jgi:hypothetical protein
VRADGLSLRPAAARRPERLVRVAMLKSPSTVRRNDDGTKRGKFAVDTQETKGTVPSLGVEKPIERVTVLLT